MNYIDEAIEIWNKEKKRLQKINAPKSVPYGDWTYHKNEIFNIALKIYKLEQLEKHGITNLLTKEKRSWR